MKSKNFHFELIPASLGTIVYLIPAYKEILSSNFCSKIFNIPGCYLVLLAYILILVSIFLKKTFVFSLGVILGLILAIRSSYHVWVGNHMCPVSDKIPLCYVSLLLLIVILILRIIRIRRSK